MSGHAPWQTSESIQSADEPTTRPGWSGEDLRATFDADPYRGYVYGYPHKTAYRALEPAVPLGPVWAQERQDALFGYLHLPFCEMRCGFCNLFTTANPPADAIGDYLDALEREARVVRELLHRPRAARLAIGGGTPTLLAPGQLERVISLLRNVFDGGALAAPLSVETSPATATRDRLRLLRELGVRRVSIGVQSMIESEVHSVGRPQHGRQVHTALDLIRADGPPVLNVDLMYGLGGQTAASWIASLERVLTWAPEEIFCYPLYVRPLTGLSGRAAWDDQRRTLYRIAVDRLAAAGYAQTSMRRFTRVAEPDDEYACQSDAMVGLGCGARSYTRALHWSREYAVRRTGIRRIIADYCTTSGDEFTVARWGFALDEEERLRRYVLQSLLHVDGLDLAAARAATGLDPLVALPQVGRLVDVGLAQQRGGRLGLTAAGLELSDAIGPWLHSSAVAARCAGHESR